MFNENKTKAFLLLLPKETHKKLRQYALDHETNGNEVIRKLIDDFFKQEEAKNE
jgi:hypothetical protein